MIHQEHEQRKNEVPKRKRNAGKKQKIGRWTDAECYLFQSLLQRYGKNWKEIQSHLKHRCSSQIRSHAQKYFEKIGPKRVQEYERRAKLLQAFQTLQKEKQKKEQKVNGPLLNLQSPNVEIKRDQEQILTQQSVLAEKSPQATKKESIIIFNKQQVLQSKIQKESNQQGDKLQNIHFPYQNNFSYFDGGYFVQMIGPNAQFLVPYQVAQGYINYPTFGTTFFQN